MSVWSELALEMGRPAAQGYSAGVIKNTNDQAALENAVRSAASLAPIRTRQLLDLFRGQKEIEQQYPKAQRPTIVPPNAVGAIINGQFVPFTGIQNAAPTVAQILASSAEVPSASAPVPARQPGYGVGEEAMAGTVPSTERIAGEKLLRRMRGVPESHVAKYKITDKGTEVDFEAPKETTATGAGLGPRGLTSRDAWALEQEAADRFPGDPVAQRRWIREQVNAFEEGTAEARTRGSVSGGYTGPSKTAKEDVAAGTSEARAAGTIRGNLRPVPSPSEPGVSVPGAAAVAETRERGKIPTQVEKKVSELERTRSLIDQIDTLSQPLITAKNWTEVLPQYVRLHVGAFTNANEAATLYQSSIDEFLGQLAREVSQERGVLTNQDIQRIKGGMPGFGNTEGVRSGKIMLLRNIIQMNQEAEESRIANGGKIPEDVRARARGRINAMLATLNTGEVGQPGKHRLSGTKTGKADGTYPLKDGTTITVKGGVVQ